MRKAIEANMLTHSEISNFNKYGFLIKRMYLAESCLDEMQHVAVHHLKNHISPIEFEAELSNTCRCFVKISRIWIYSLLNYNVS